MLYQSPLFLTIKYMLRMLTAYAVLTSYQACASEEVSEQAHKAYVPRNHYQALGTLSKLPQELVDEIFSYCPQEAITINRASFTIITGYQAEDIKKKGIATLPTYMTYPYLSNQKADFHQVSNLLQSIPSYIWYKRV